MPIDDEDRAIKTAPKYMRDTNDGQATLRAIYRAGLAAGIERAAKVCERFPRAHTYASENADHYRGFDAGVERCAAAIRALLQPPS